MPVVAPALPLHMCYTVAVKAPVVTVVGECAVPCAQRVDQPFCVPADDVATARRLPHSIVLCRFSIPQQLDSVAKLLQYDWLHVLPGHGRPAHLRDASHRLEAVSKLLQHHNHTTPAAAAQQQQAAGTKAAAR